MINYTNRFEAIALHTWSMGTFIIKALSRFDNGNGEVPKGEEDAKIYNLLY